MWIVTALFKPLAYVSVPYLILKYATDTNPTARYYFRVVVYYSALGFCSVWGMIVAAGMSLAGHRFDINWVVARSFYTLAGKLLDIKFVVEGEEHLDTKPAVLVGNHQSGLDILFLGRYVPFPIALPSPSHVKLIRRHSFPFLADSPNRRVIQDFPEACVYHGQEGAGVGSVVGRISLASGAVFVDRRNNTAAVESLKAAGDFMKKNTQPLVVIPRRHTFDA
jgi:lysophosphatidate acyltransferase